VHILFLTQVLPYPLDAGPKTRAYYVLRHLTESHQVTLVSFVRQSDTPEAIAHLKQFCRGVYTVPMPRSKWRDGVHLLRSLVLGQPFIMARDWLPAMAAKLSEVVTSVGPVDAVHADQLWMAPYALYAKEILSTGHCPKLVLDQHNAVYLIPQRLMGDERNPLKRALLQLETYKLARYEVDVCSRFDHVVWVTKEDFQAVQSQALAQAEGVGNSGVIPICVDPDLATNVKRRTDAQRITFLGGLHYPPNAEGICWFAEKVFGRILVEVPNAVLTVIGRQPPLQLTKLGIPQANLDVTGYVDDPRPYLEETAVFIVPLHAAGGMRVKILDAWAWGMPMVSTTVGAEGTAIQPGENILIADSPEAFAAATISLLIDSQRGRQLATAGQEWVRRHYDWRTAYQMWDRIYTTSSR
jgi:polysaccharide biosynthesis protein PslH